MAFNSKKIKDQNPQLRTKEFDAPEFMLDGFDENDEKVIKIRGLTGEEFVECQQAFQKYELEKAFFEGMSKKDAEKYGGEIAEYFGHLTEKTDQTSQKAKTGILLGVTIQN